MQKAIIGGVLGIVASALGMLGSLFMFAMPALMSSSSLGTEYDEAFSSLMSGFYIFFGVIGLLLGILGIVGGICSVRRKIFGLALTGAIVSSIIFFPLGIVAVILVSMGYPEFKKTEPVLVPAVTLPSST